MLKLLPIEIGPHFLDQQLPFDLYNQHGVLVARSGSVIRDQVRLARTVAATSPLATLQAIADFYARSIMVAGHPDGGDLVSLAGALRQLVHEFPEVCVGMAQRLPLASLAQRHALFVATLGIILARHAGMNAPRQVAIAGAALSMNLASMSIQDQLSASTGGPDAAQREALFRHPQQASALLRQAGVSDEAWLAAVEQHHEYMDGSGYPLGLKGDQISLEARIVRAADIWGALVSHRHNRLAHYPIQVFREIFVRERGRLDDATLLRLRHLMGHFPPGTLVRLANRETALVTRWFGDRRVPGFAISMLRSTGRPVARPQMRDTSQPTYAIRGYTYLPLYHGQIDWERLWAVG